MAWPSLALSGSELALALTRGAFVAALLSAFGAALFTALAAPAAAHTLPASKAEATDGHSVRLVRASLVAAMLTLCAWLALEASAMAEAANARAAVVAIPAVLSDTSFGRLLIAQAGAVLAGLCVVTLRPLWWPYVTAVLAGIATALQAGHSHAFAMDHGPSLLLVSQALHLLAAGAWLGGLLPLLMLLRGAGAEAATAALRRFSGLAAICVAAIAITAWIQGWSLAGGVAGLIGTAYGWVLLAKTTLFVLLLVLAARNRFRLTPALARGEGPRWRRALVRAIAAEIGIGLVVVLLAGVLSGLEPGMHAAMHGAQTGAPLTMP